MTQRAIYWAGALALFVFGCFLRVLVWHPAYDPGFDEQVYVRYLDQVESDGWMGFPDIVHTYIDDVQKAETVYLPPHRVGYLFPSWLVARLTGIPNYQALRLVSALASCLFTLVGFLFARRWLTPRKALAVLGILVCTPVQIHLAQFAFIDSVAGLWAILVVGCLWESLQQPRHGGWLCATATSYFFLCCTKQETAVFVSVFLLAALVLARRAGFSESRWRQFLALAGAGTLTLITLALLSGGVRPLVEAFAIFRERNATLPYAIQTGDGPWYRYFFEYLLVNPLVFLLATGFAMRGDLAGKRNLFLLGFILVSGVVMTSIPYAMNIRYTVMWDFPLAIFAVQGVATLVVRRRYSAIWAAAIIALVCYSELRQYGTIFRKLYDTDLRFMLQAVRILK